MPVTIDGTNGITNGGGYTGDGVSFADATPANTLVTTTTGRVGIGTASPGAKSDIYAGSLGTTAGNTLDLAYVWGSTNNTSRLVTRLVRTSNGSDWTTAALRLQAVVDVDNQAYIDMIPAGGTYGMAFGTGTGGTPSERMRIDSAGNVGIGTSSPKGKLQVNGGDIVTDATRGLLTNLYYEGGWKYVGNGYGAYIVPDTAGSGILTIAQAPNNTSGAGAAATPVERMRITSAGAIGINTDNPQSTLQVVGPFRAGAGPTDGTNASFTAYSDGTGISLEAFQGNFSSTKRNMWLAAYGGNVGVGTNAPGVKLDVAGSIRVSNNQNVLFTDTVGTACRFVAQSDNNFVFYTTDASGNDRPIWGIFTRNSTGNLGINVNITDVATYNNLVTGRTMIVTSGGVYGASSSSIKYKKDVEDLDPALVTNAIDGLRPVYYRTKNPQGDDKATWSHIGLIAEEVHEVEPRLVHYRTLEVTEETKPVLDEVGDPVLDEEGNPVFTKERVEHELETPEPEDVDYARLSVLLLAKVKELEARLAAVEGAIA